MIRCSRHYEFHFALLLFSNQAVLSKTVSNFLEMKASLCPLGSTDTDMGIGMTQRHGIFWKNRTWLWWGTFIKYIFIYIFYIFLSICLSYNVKYISFQEK